MKLLTAPKQKLSSIAVALAVAGMAAVPVAGRAQEKANPVCPSERAHYNPGNGEDIAVPRGFKVEVFARDLNMPTDIAFVGNKDRFQVIVLESGTGLPSQCNDNTKVPGVGKFAANNPFTPNVLVFDQDGNKLSGPLGKPTTSGGGFQPDGPAIGLTFEREAKGGRLFATDSNQGVRGAPGTGNNWDYGGTSTLDGSKLAPETARTIFADYDFPAALVPAFDANDAFRLMIATGIYDLLTTVGPARLLAAGYRHPFGMAGVRKRAIAALGVGQPERTAHSHVSS